DQWMRSVAAEMNLSETAFVRARRATTASAADSPREFDLRWFTPTVEIDLCGHATLASAFALGETGAAPADAAIRFHTRSGPLTVARAGAALPLDLPARPPEPAPADPALAHALGAAPREVMRARDIVAIFDRAEDVRALRPDSAAILALGVHA